DELHEGPFPHDPFAEIDRTVLERGALGLAPCEKSDGMPVDEAHVLQVQRLPRPRFGVDDPLQLADVLDTDSTTHGEDHEGAPNRSLDPQHRRRFRTQSRGQSQLRENAGERRSSVTTLRKFPKCRDEAGIDGWTPPTERPIRRSEEDIAAGLVTRVGA